MEMTRELFFQLVRPVLAFAAARPLDADLDAALNAQFPYDGNTCMALRRACRDAIAAGWMCAREAGGIRYGRVLKPTPDSHGFSIDVVQMQDVAGPHHRHPHGEIDLIMPLTPEAKFDGRPGGWLVYPPGSEHAPTVSDGAALVLYLLPEGAIEFGKPGG